MKVPWPQHMSPSVPPHVFVCCGSTGTLPGANSLCKGALSLLPGNPEASEGSKANWGCQNQSCHNYIGVSSVPERQASRGSQQSSVSEWGHKVTSYKSGCPCFCGRHYIRRRKLIPFHGMLHQPHGCSCIRRQGHHRCHVPAHPEDPRPAVRSSSTAHNSKLILSLLKTKKIFQKEGKKKKPTQVLMHFPV